MIESVTFDREIRGIPLWLLREYLVELGGQVQQDDCVVGAGWSARLTQLEDFSVGSLRVGQVQIEICGEESAMKALRGPLETKLIRGGG